MRCYVGFAESFYYAYVYGRSPFLRAPACGVVSVDDALSRLGELRQLDLAGLGICVPPDYGPGSLCPVVGGAGKHHLLVSGAGNRCRNDELVRHTWNGPIPQGSFSLVGPGVYMSTPEFTFVQLATVLPPALLAQVGCSMCASYRLDATTGLIVECEPLTTPEALRAYVRATSGMRGAKKAKRVLPWIAAGAESPMEITLYLLMRLPLSLGGRGVHGLEMNYRIEPNVDDAPILDRPSRKYYRVDVGSRTLHAGVEYLGKHHELQAAADRARQNALLALGERTLQVVYADLADPVRCDKVANQFSRLLGVELASLSPSQQLARGRLMDALFGAGALKL